MSRMYQIVLLFSIIVITSCGTSRPYDDGIYAVQDSYYPIPANYYPAPGYYRIWYPGRSVNYQPAPVRGYLSGNRVPPGAWVVYCPENDRSRVFVDEYDSRRRGVIRRTRDYAVQPPASAPAISRTKSTSDRVQPRQAAKEQKIKSNPRTIRSQPATPRPQPTEKVNKSRGVPNNKADRNNTGAKKENKIKPSGNSRPRNK